MESNIEKNRVQKIIRLHQEIGGLFMKSLDKAILIGSLILQQKKSMNHGEWIPWIEKNLPFKERTARNYLRVYRERDNLKRQAVADLNTAYKLLAEPKEDKAEKQIQEYIDRSPPYKPSEAIQIFHGEFQNVCKNMPDESVNLICADPPYNIGGLDWDRFESEEKYLDWCNEWLRLLYALLKISGSIYIFGMFKMLRKISIMMDEIGYTFKNYIVWDTIQGGGSGLWVNRHEGILFYVKSEDYFCDKEAIKINRHEGNIRIYGGREYKFKDPSNIWRIPCVDNKHKDRTGHPTQKPVEMISRMIKASCPVNGIVLDPFGGSGTVAEACKATNRRCIIIEKEEKYVSVIKARISSYTPEQLDLISVNL